MCYLIKYSDNVKQYYKKIIFKETFENCFEDVIDITDYTMFFGRTFLNCDILLVIAILEYLVVMLYGCLRRFLSTVMAVHEHFHDVPGRPQRDVQKRFQLCY